MKNRPMDLSVSSSRVTTPPVPLADGVLADSERPIYHRDAVLDGKQLAAALGTSQRTIERMDLPAFYVGKRTPRYLYGQVLDVLRERALREAAA